MKHLFPILGFLTLSLASCTGCTKKNTSVPVCSGTDCEQPIVPVVSRPDAGVTSSDKIESSDSLNQTLSGDGWELVLPEGFDSVVLEDEEKPAVLVVNKEEHSLVLLIKEPFTGSIPEYVVGAVRGIAEEKGILRGNKHGELNGNKYVLLDSAKDGTRVWMWLLVKNGFGYALSCGGPEAEDHHEALCAEVANTLKLH